MIIYLVLIIIVVLYLLFSYFVKGPRFYFFDLFWRVGIIVAVFVWGKLSINLSSFMWLLLFLLFAANYGFVFWFSKKFNLKTTPMTDKKIQIAIAVAMAPVAEELFFRGWLLWSLPSLEISTFGTIMLSSFLFGLYHLKNLFRYGGGFPLFYQIVYATLFIGPILAVAQINTSSLFLPILMHSINNTLAETITRKFFPRFISKLQ